MPVMDTVTLDISILDSKVRLNDDHGSSRLLLLAKSFVWAVPLLVKPVIGVLICLICLILLSYIGAQNSCSNNDSIGDRVHSFAVCLLCFVNYKH